MQRLVFEFLIERRQFPRTFDYAPFQILMEGPQFLFRALALGNVAYDGDEQPSFAARQLTDGDLYREGIAVFAPPHGLVGHDTGDGRLA